MMRISDGETPLVFHCALYSLQNAALQMAAGLLLQQRSSGLLTPGTFTATSSLISI